LYLAPPAAATNHTIASGHITAGAPHTQVLTAAEAGVGDGVDSFFFAAPLAGTLLTTSTVDNGGFGYDLDFYFFDAAGNYVDSDCQTEAPDEFCVVPAGAADGEVAAWLGADLDVNVIDLTNPAP
jgi:hypothetical protein